MQLHSTYKQTEVVNQLINSSQQSEHNHANIERISANEFDKYEIDIPFWTRMK